MLIDSHIHLPKNPDTLANVLQNAKVNDVNKVIAIGTDVKEAMYAIEIANDNEMVFACIGIYPNSQRNTPITKLVTDISNLIPQSSKIVAIGEIGLDITQWKQQRSLENQIKLFEAQIQLAIKHNLPIVIHNRNGNEYVLNSLQKFPRVRGVAHCFDTNWEFAQKLLNIGFYISFSGFITHNSKKYLLETVKNVPLDRFLVETDSPYIMPKGLPQGQNEPKNVTLVAQKIAQVKQISYEEVCVRATQNTQKLFNLK